MLASALEIFGPNLQPLQLGDELANQIDQPGGLGYRQKMLQPLPRRLLVDDPAEQLAFHQPGDLSDRLSGLAEHLDSELVKGGHSRREAARQIAVEQPVADFGRGPPGRGQPEGGFGRSPAERVAVEREQPFGLAASCGATDDGDAYGHLLFSRRKKPTAQEAELAELARRSCQPANQRQSIEQNTDRETFSYLGASVQVIRRPRCIGGDSTFETSASRARISSTTLRPS